VGTPVVSLKTRRAGFFIQARLAGDLLDVWRARYTIMWTMPLRGVPLGLRGVPSGLSSGSGPQAALGLDPTVTDRSDVCAWDDVSYTHYMATAEYSPGIGATWSRFHADIRAAFTAELQCLRARLIYATWKLPGTPRLGIRHLSGDFIDVDVVELQQDTRAIGVYSSDNPQGAEIFRYTTPQNLWLDPASPWAMPTFMALRPPPRRILEMRPPLREAAPREAAFESSLVFLCLRRLVRAFDEAATRRARMVIASAIASVIPTQKRAREDDDVLEERPAKRNRR
jgi:hypothetical protein